MIVVFIHVTDTKKIMSKNLNKKRLRFPGIRNPITKQIELKTILKAWNTYIIFHPYYPFCLIRP